MNNKADPSSKSHSNGRFKWFIYKPMYLNRPLPPKRRNQIASRLEAAEKEKTETEANEKLDAEWNALPVWEQAIMVFVAWWLTPVIGKINRLMAIGTGMLILMIVSGWAWIQYFPIHPEEAKTPVIDPAALLAPAAETPVTGVDPAALLMLTPNGFTPAPTSIGIVDCTVATCPDATQYKVNYAGKYGEGGSATLRSTCSPGATVLGEIPKDTVVWVKTSTIHKGSFCEEIDSVMECRAAEIHPIAGIPFASKGGCISLTAAQPVNP